jgi:hypothetical protein
VLSDRSARRFAQDDDSVVGIKKHWVVCKKHEKIEKVTSSRDDKWRAVTFIRAVRWMDRKETESRHYSGSTAGRDRRDDKFV